MKKWIISLLVIGIMLFSSIYIFIPSRLTVSTVRYVKAYHNSVLNFFSDSSKLTAFFKNVSVKTKDGFEFKGFHYTINKVFSNIVEINIQSDKIQSNSKLLSLSIYLDSSAIQWSSEIPTSINPIERIIIYQNAVRMKESMSGLADELSHYVSNSKNLYGITVREVHLKDSVLISTKIFTKNYPTISETYSLVKKLTDYAASNNVKTTNYPMLFVKNIAPGNYETMVGLPVNTLIPETNDIKIKRMPYNGNILTSEIKGGPYSIQKGYEQFNSFVLDSRRVVMAIPFELLISDRSKTDTANWITILHYPIM